MFRYRHSCIRGGRIAGALRPIIYSSGRPTINPTAASNTTPRIIPLSMQEGKFRSYRTMNITFLSSLTFDPQGTAESRGLFEVQQILFAPSGAFRNQIFT